MKLTQTFNTLICLFACLSLTAQIEQVSLNPGYTVQAFYNVDDGSYETIENESWDLMFTNIGMIDAGIHINESVSFMGVGLELYIAETSDWTEVIVIDTTIQTPENSLHNDELSWENGALNNMRNEMNPFDYGWGIYDPSIFTVVGKKIFILKKRNGDYIKLQIQELGATAEYKFRYANLDGTGEVEKSISRIANSDLIYFSLESGEEVEIPQDYDLIFQRYTVLLDDMTGSGNKIQYVLTGVLSGLNTKVVELDEIQDPSNIDISEHLEDMSFQPDIIGHDWKEFDFQAGWIIDFNRHYLLELADGSWWRITFLDFEGSATGITTLEKEFLGIGVSTNEEIGDKFEINIAPNPVSEFLTVRSSVEIDKIQLINFEGKTLREYSTNFNNLTIPADVVNGEYLLRLQIGDEFFVEKILIIK